MMDSARRLVLAAVMALGLASCSAQSPEELSLDAVPADGCSTSPGSTVYLYIFDYSTPECIAVGSHQSLEIWNKGVGTTTVEWFGSQRIQSDESFETEPVGDLLEPGFYKIHGGPFVMPMILVVDQRDSPSALLDYDSDQFGGVRVGDTIDQAEDELGIAFDRDLDLADPSACWTMGISGDPYSPVFYGKSGTDTISLIEVTHPNRTVIGDRKVCQNS